MTASNDFFIKSGKAEVKEENWQELLQNLDLDEDLKQLISVATLPEHSFLQQEGQCFLKNTLNGNYNAIHIAAILAPSWNTPDGESLRQEIAALLRQRTELFSHTEHLVQNEVGQKKFCFLGVEDTLLKEIELHLIETKLLAAYYADLALFRITLCVRAQERLPQKLVSLSPGNFFELLDSLRWPPIDENTQRRTLMKTYKVAERGLYILNRLITNNPVEFDSNSSSFTQRQDKVTS